MTTQTTQSVFSGLKVVEIASFIAAPAAATMLSDFGADVIKVEPPGLGDPQRLLSSVPPSPAAPGNYSWHLANRNKRGMSIDLKSEGGTEILKRLVQWADVVITNFPHGTRESLHLGYEEVSGWNPRVDLRRHHRIRGCRTGCQAARFRSDRLLVAQRAARLHPRCGCPTDVSTLGQRRLHHRHGGLRGDHDRAVSPRTHRARCQRRHVTAGDRGVGDGNTGVGGFGRRQAVRTA